MPISRPAALLALALLAACAPGPRTAASTPAAPGFGPDPPEDALVLGDTLRVRVMVMAGLEHDTAKTLGVYVEAGARGDAPADAEEGGGEREPWPRAVGGVCVDELALWREAEAAPAWRARREGVRGCSERAEGEPPRGGEPAPGPWEIPMAEVLGDSLPVGWYRAAVLVGGDTLGIRGRVYLDTLPPLREARRLRYDVGLRVEGVPPRLTAELRITNPLGRRAQVEYGGCAFMLRAYRTPDRAGEPAWRSELRGPPGSPHPGAYACPLYLTGAFLEPGETFTSRRDLFLSIPFEEILGDTLPEGRYWFAADFDVQYDNPHREPGEYPDTLRVPAGAAEITRRVHPTPAAWDVGPVRLRATTEPVPGAPGRRRVVLRATNTGKEPARAAPGDSSGAWPVTVVAYATPEERDRWHRGAKWSWSVDVSLRPVPAAPLAPGETRAFRGDFAVPPPHERRHLAVFLELDGVGVTLDAGRTK